MLGWVGSKAHLRIRRFACRAVFRPRAAGKDGARPGSAFIALDHSNVVIFTGVQSRDGSLYVPVHAPFAIEARHLSGADEIDMKTWLDFATNDAEKIPLL